MIGRNRDARYAVGRMADVPQGEMMTDPISTLLGLSKQRTERDGELRSGFAQLQESLVAATQGVAVDGASDNCTLERLGDSEAVYGHLFFSSSALQVAYRSTEEDSVDALEGNRFDPTFSVTTPQDCRAPWLHALAAPAVVESLVSSITSAVRTSVVTAVEGVQVLAAAASLPERDLNSAVVNAAEKLGYQVVLEDWRQAQSELGVNPSDAVTRACRLLESLCKHILQTRNQQLPDGQSIQPLFKAAVKSLNLSPDQQASDDLRMIASGIFTIAQGVGMLRTHASSAHGSAASGHQVTFAEARLAVNSAGAVATFLMDTLSSLEQMV